ncbi:ABC transporter ATP-binding protein [Pseudonocardia pini]|uniref:ABC transporter ATP-binding protein n=1 Tax=Pseudonocardia pini TaxID=2758030 RepID=UPI001C68FB83|nr:ATP-binding cassette domain-containing protein [Pseudonocardia pini]
MSVSRADGSPWGPTAPAVIDLQGVGFGYTPDAPVLADITLSLAAGSVVGIVGPSGCGKSTLLSLLAGLRRPTSGSLERRTDVADRHPLSMVFQKDTVLPWKTVVENAGLYATFRGRRRAAEDGEPPGPRVRRLLEMAHLSEVADAYPYQLSGGMRRRLAFVTAVAPGPQILLLDEPFSSVDEPTRIGIHQDVFAITRGMGMTTVLVTHDLAEAITLCDRVLILSRGPSRIAHEHRIDFGPERDMLRLRGTPTYQAAYADLWRDLSAEIAASSAAAAG